MFGVSRLEVYVLGVLFVATGTWAEASDDSWFFHENVMGTSLELHARADTAEAADQAEATVLKEIDRLSSIFSGYDPQSEFSRWLISKDVDFRVSLELFEVLRTSEHWVKLSHGAFDPRVEALSRLWSECQAGDRVPARVELDAARALMRRPAWQLDLEHRAARRLTACPLSLNGIAKGYIVERTCELAFDRVRGVRGLLLNVGGDLRLRGEIDGTLGIASPWADSESSEPIATIVAPANRSVATSGKSQRGFEIRGRWYSHILDPRSGMPVDRVASVTVIADRSVDADALAKVFSVLEPDESLRLVRSLPGVECLIVTGDGRLSRSGGFGKFEVARPMAVTLASQNPSDAKHVQKAMANGKGSNPAAWNLDHELVVNFEINQPAGQRGRYRRPYVAIWVEDKEGNLVRTLALWVSMGGAGPFQWLPDLKRWYQVDQAKKLIDKKDNFFTISRPTRPAGKYKVSWDGKDDNGKVRGQGNYVISIEAAREHGTYQIIRRPVTIADQPFSEDLKGNVEIKSAGIEYRRKAAPK